MKYIIPFIICFQVLSLGAQDLKFGLGAGIGVNSQRYSSLDLTGPVNIFRDFPQWQTPESFLFNAYVEKMIKPKWGLNVGIEANEYTHKRTATFGFLTVFPYHYYWQYGANFMFSRYFKISQYGNRLKVGMGPQLSVYPLAFDTRFGNGDNFQYLSDRTRNLSRFNFSAKLLCMYNSRLTENSALNLGFLINYGIHNPIENTISYYQNAQGFGNDPILIRPDEKDLYQRIRRVLHPVQFMFVIQYELWKSK